jgi:hypothetical protein
VPPPYADIKVPMRAKQIEDALADLAATFGTLCTRTVLPNKTSEQRASSYLKIANGTGTRPVVLFTGGVHAREWAPPDALITFARNLLVAYTAKKAIKFPAMTVTALPPSPPQGPRSTPIPVQYPSWTIPAADVQTIVNSVDLYLFPLVNPDGRELDLRLLSPTTPPPPYLSPSGMWRKNVTPQKSTPPIIPQPWGVDINRNFNIIWRFENYYDVASYLLRYHNHPPAGRDPRGDEWRGNESAPGSDLPDTQPETGNVQSLLDNLPINYFVDVHTSGPNILYAWGMEGDGDDPTMNYNAAAYKGNRDGFEAGDPTLPAGKVDYKEFFPDVSPYYLRSRAETIAWSMHDAILQSSNGGTPPAPGSAQQVHSKYEVGQSAFLYVPAGWGPNSGTSEDYATSRQFVNPSRMPIFAYTLEMGRDEELGFHCDYGAAGHFRKINREIHAALHRLLMFAAGSPLPRPTPTPVPSPFRES